MDDTHVSLASKLKNSGLNTLNGYKNTKTLSAFSV
jgi:hypothetical protein